MARRDGKDTDGLTPPQKRVLEIMATGLSITAAAQHAKVGRSTIYAWRNEDGPFASRMDDAYEAGVDTLEDHALKRAHDADKPSDALTMFLLKAHRPARYRERVDLRHSGELHQVKRIIMDGAPELSLSLSPGDDPELVENLEGKLALESEDNDRLRGELENLDRDQEPDDE